MFGDEKERHCLVGRLQRFPELQPVSPGQYLDEQLKTKTPQAPMEDSRNADACGIPSCDQVAHIVMPVP